MKQGALRYAKVLISGNLKSAGNCVRSESCQVTVSREGTEGPLCLKSHSRSCICAWGLQPQ